MTEQIESAVRECQCEYMSEVARRFTPQSSLGSISARSPGGIHIAALGTVARWRRRFRYASQVSLRRMDKGRSAGQLEPLTERLPLSFSAKVSAMNVACAKIALRAKRGSTRQSIVIPVTAAPRTKD